MKRADGLKRKVKIYTRRYPWQVWFRKSVFTIVRGVDFDNRCYVMAQMIRNVARDPRYNLSVSISISDDDKTLTVKVKRRASVA